jgi:HTH-type transcriptional regulator / antitoxin HigA
MVDTAPFAPDWVSPPGETIATVLRERGVSSAEIAGKLNRSEAAFRGLLLGQTEIDRVLARELARELGTTEQFWLKREEQYRQGLARLLEEGAGPAGREWLQEIPTRDMVRLGWVASSPDLVGTVASCLRFFGVASVAAWRESYRDTLQAIAFRTSKAFASDMGAVAAWLRQGELLVDGLTCGPWDPDKFREELAGMRALTREREPDVFLPELVRRCAACGVAVVVLRAPKGCKASGASRFLSPIRPMLMLSFRHLSDDHFWFSFFHEAAHLLLHGDQFIFLEGDDEMTSAEEAEADAFAAEVLVPAEFRDEMLRLPVDGIKVARFAKKVGVSPGIIVGQLQHLKRLRHNQLNNLKRRFEWSEE